MNVPDDILMYENWVSAKIEEFSGVQYEKWLEATIEDKSSEIEVLQCTKDFKTFETDVIRACKQGFESLDELQNNVWLNIVDPTDPENDYSVDTLEMFPTEPNFKYEEFKEEKLKDEDMDPTTYKFTALIALGNKNLTICLHAKIWIGVDLRYHDYCQRRLMSGDC